MTINDDQNTGKLPSQVSRRTLAIGAAWSVPVIAVASAAPAYALSGTVTVDFLGACKSPGNSCSAFPKGYFAAFTVCNNTAATIVLELTSIDNETLCGDPISLDAINPPVDQTVAPGDCSTLFFGFDDNGSSPDCELEADLTFTYWPTSDPSDTATVEEHASASTTPPPNNPKCTIPEPPQCA